MPTEKYLEDLNKEIEEYNIQHHMASYSKYNMHLDVDNSEQLSEYIHNNYSSMDRKEMETVALKLLSDNQLKHTLLKFELENYVPKEINMNKDTFVKTCHSILIRYQSKAGGFKIDDTEWSTDTDVEGCVAFLNTVTKPNFVKEETQQYLKSLVNRLNNVATNYDVELKSDIYDGVVWVVIFAKNV